MLYSGSRNSFSLLPHLKFVLRFGDVAHVSTCHPWWLTAIYRLHYADSWTVFFRDHLLDWAVQCKHCQITIASDDGYYHPHKNLHKPSAKWFNLVSPSPPISTGTCPEPSPPASSVQDTQITWLMQMKLCFLLPKLHCLCFLHLLSCSAAQRPVWLCRQLHMPQSYDANIKYMVWTMEWLLVGLVGLFCQVMHICSMNWILGRSEHILLGNQAQRSPFSHLELCIVIMFSHLPQKLENQLGEVFKIFVLSE